MLWGWHLWEPHLLALEGQRTQTFGLHPSGEVPATAGQRMGRHSTTVLFRFLEKWCKVENYGMESLDHKAYARKISMHLNLCISWHFTFGIVGASYNSICLENLVGSPAINQNEPEVEIREHSKTTFRSLLLTLHSSGDLGGRGKGFFFRLFLDIVFPLYILHHFGLNQTIDACSNVAGPWI